MQNPGADREALESFDSPYGASYGSRTAVCLAVSSEGDDEQAAYGAYEPKGIGETYHSWELGGWNMFDVAKDVARCHDFALGINQ